MTRHRTGTARSGPPPDRPPTPAPPTPPAWRNWLLIAGLVLTVVLFLLPVPTARKVEQLSYSQLKQDIAAGQVASVALIDEEVAKLLRQAEQRATGLLREHHDALERLTGLLLERETIDGTDVDEVLGRVPGQRQPVGATGHSATATAADGSATAMGRGGR